jgi:hypothetical protein
MGGDGYVPRFRNLNKRDKRFIRGYAYVFNSGNTPSHQYLPGYGNSLLKEINGIEGAGFSNLLSKRRQNRPVDFFRFAKLPLEKSLEAFDTRRLPAKAARQMRTLVYRQLPNDAFSGSLQNKCR